MRALAVRDKIANGGICGAPLVCLDLEFSSSTGKVFEIGGCEYYSGKTFIDTKIKHDCSSSELHKSQDLEIPTDPFSELISKRVSVRVYGGNPATSKGVSDVHEVASLLREAGISPKTLVLV
jgi:hypothetical protein